MHVNALCLHRFGNVNPSLMHGLFLDSVGEHVQA